MVGTGTSPPRLATKTDSLALAELYFWPEIRSPLNSRNENDLEGLARRKSRNFRRLKSPGKGSVPRGLCFGHTRGLEQDAEDAVTTGSVHTDTITTTRGRTQRHATIQRPTE